MYRILISVFIVLCIVSLLVGTDPVSWTGLLSGSDTDWLTVKASRFPRLIAIVLTGMGLSIGGVILQHIVRNKFVEPETAGGLDAAKLGILVSLVLLPSAGVLSKMLAALLFCFVAGLIYIWIIARIRFQQGMGQQMAASLGVSYKTTVAIGLMLVSVTVAATVITVGSIPFIGLVIPNLVAIKYGEHLARTLPVVALGGACLLLGCDITGRLLIYPFEIPIGLTAGAVGGIVFLLLILRGLR